MTTETKNKTDSETQTKEEAKEEEIAKPVFAIESIDDFRRILMIAKGGDPDAIQVISDFMDLKSNIERTYFPDRTTSIAIGQLTGLGQMYYPNHEWDPFTVIADCLAIAFMPYKGFKSNQFVDMTRQTPNLQELQTFAEGSKQGIVGRILQRSESE